MAVELLIRDGSPAWWESPDIWVVPGTDPSGAEGPPVAGSTAVYMLTTCATRNPALVLASGVMGTLFAAQRRSSGGLLAPILTHITWSALMLRYLPVLFRKPPEDLENA